ncbi:RagB/SusD family nutrient uptake outer membrane protein [Pontibacter sp. E15-1]|uniref:RagB/SusD family nutrient uptake outer membrane protein n=1 Tax=Pontibacter sp. E15-1 TaxID=2919918 RepID=UPI001F4F3ED7|nr:RagB/SusD family nutrient uptake outer membrane protein [Pontibacter sp. E15-1]MCJ8165781.1 RagB/SusD family nutrient uptake outer membrane protein [Pontibacter sp. E15-1]
MNRIYKMLAVAAVVSLTGCEDHLDQAPIGLLTPEQVNTDPTLASVISSVNSSYQPLSSTLNILGNWDWNGGKVLRNDFILQDIASGDMQKKWNPDGDQAWMDQVGNFNFTAANGAFNGIWSYDYEGISRANYAISYLEDEAVIQKINIDTQLKNRLLGEAYFLRSFYYFDLVVNFGDVPLLLKPLESFGEAYSVATRVEKEKVWEQIRADLDKAKTLLPDSRYASASEPWRASKGAALAMQAKVALYSQNWQKVVDTVTEMEGLGYYSLNQNYFDSFSTAKEFNEQEVIFAFNHEEGQTPRTGNGLAALMGWGFVAPTQDFVNEFEPNDPRLGLTVNVADQAVYKLLGATDTGNKGNDDSAGNKVFIRWADVLLWKAEALNELGQQQAAVEIINSVRARARTSATADGSMAPAGTLPDRATTADKEQVKQWIMHERRVELGFESQRFNDLRRWNVADEVLTGMGKNFQANNYLYPIPQGEIDKSGGQIMQNAGY